MDLFDPFAREAPVQYSSPNAPRVPDVLGTLLLSVVSGHPDRLNRATLMLGIDEGFASPHRAREELRAEISSMMTGDRLRRGRGRVKGDCMLEVLDGLLVTPQFGLFVAAGAVGGGVRPSHHVDPTFPIARSLCQLE